MFSILFETFGTKLTPQRAFKRKIKDCKEEKLVYVKRWHNKLLKHRQFIQNINFNSINTMVLLITVKK